MHILNFKPCVMIDLCHTKAFCYYSVREVSVYMEYGKVT
jgi:hypothetical protein